METVPNSNYEFGTACQDGNIYKVVEMLKEVDSYQKQSGLYYACAQGNIEIVKLILQHVDQVGIQCLDIACHMSYRHNSMGRHMTIIKLLLEHTKFDTTEKLFTDRNILLPTEIKTLLDEHVFALDGPEYNKNIF